MIICVCRRLNTKKVETAIKAGATTPACVLAHHGTRFNCGKCRPEICNMLSKTSIPESSLTEGQQPEPVMMAAE
ncbi:bacterioferritin-associated ferredoxin [Parvularcula sp. IMCC14364]|uniref:(2Fe-2S)-binding protein n=1 Tax=Parvularcula sp. IMCC14364 TaxID=3067902 RepID=UPI002741BA4D|nr:(2Fe-2S)-binding protein [Parvularcula sp. IMCC14364]